MFRKIGLMGAVAALFAFTTGCVTVVEGDKVFTVTGSKFIIGASIEDVEAQVPFHFLVFAEMPKRFE